ncbi:S-layer homology domain-containing protein [Paenisporosarcina indica]|uniref:S-layer homology domain-containing protein n=1 Tax=Paenisporosarcina indica TaxID=650093 RepID=UPI0009501ED6|nr:S-layer homology domain-containing protein [Paenisporosarcina indica]
MKKLLALILVVILTVSTFSFSRVSAAGFSDVPSNHGFYTEIMYLVDKGVISQTGTFGVDQKVTREEVAVMVSKAVGLSGGKTKTPFKDVPSTSASSGYIKSAVDAGVLSGFTDGTFRPKQIVNRGEMAIFLAKAFKLTTESTTKFKDMSSSMASYISVKKIVQAKITTGYSDSTFRPTQTLTRGQISAFLARAMGAGKESGAAKTYSTKQIVAMNDSKVVLIETDVSQGSGIVIANGLILTNHHVMRGASSATVIFNDGTEYQVSGVVESNPKKDIAIIKTSKTFNVSGVNVRSSSQGLSKGEKVVAIGSPQGLQNTVSDGIISALRVIDGVSTIQTNADIDQGSSGGALFNENGQLIGMTSSGYDDVMANLNFAIATEEFVPLVNKYKTMNFGSVPASFIPSPTQVPVLGNVALGMTMEQVKQLTQGNYVEEDATELFYSDVNAFGYQADVIYEFQNNKLFAMTVYHYIANQTEVEILEDYFYGMYDDLVETYGVADDLNRDWNDDEEDYSLYAYWMTPAHHLLLSVTMTIDNESFGGIRFEVL